MRLDPWHLRVPNNEHHQWYQNLVDLHQLTREFMSLKNLPPGRITPEKFTIETFIDDDTVQETLGKLEHTVWKTQAEVLLSVSAPIDSTQPLLKQQALKMGQTCFKSRWNEIEHLEVRKLQDLREILLCLRDSPFSGYPHGDGFFIKRSTAKEVQLELQFCPHRLQYSEIKPVSDLLCQLHSEWMLGFVQELSPSIRLEHSIQSPRCLQRWTLAE